MIFTFGPTYITDSVRIEKSLQINKLTPREYDAVLDQSNKRDKFKADVQNFLQNIYKGIKISDIKNDLDDYLKTNVDMLQLLAKKQSFPMNFQYQSSLQPQSKPFTLTTNNEEACVVEIIMVRYCCAFLHYADADRDCKEFQALIPKTLTEFIKEDFLQEIKDKVKVILAKYYDGWLYMHKVYSFMPQLQPSFTKDTLNIVDIKPECILAVKEILEVNANNIFMENLRIRKDWQIMSQLCKSNYIKLQRTLQNLKVYSDIVNKGILIFCEFGSQFYKACGLYAYLMQNEDDYKSKEYNRKNFFELSKELYFGSKTLAKLCDQIKFAVEARNTDIYQYALLYCTQLIEPAAKKWSTIYEDQSIKNQVPLEDGESYFDNIVGDFDYLNAIHQKKTQEQ